MKKKKEQKQQLAGKKSPSSGAKKVPLNKRKYYGALGAILLISIVIYLPILQNGFVWDDSGYILGNNLIKDFSWTGIKAIFNNFSSDNYAPVTDLIRAFQYKLSGFNPVAFHIGSVIFHLVNVALVFA